MRRVLQPCNRASTLLNPSRPVCVSISPPSLAAPQSTSPRHQACRVIIPQSTRNPPASTSAEHHAHRVITPHNARRRTAPSFRSKPARNAAPAIAKVLAFPEDQGGPQRSSTRVIRPMAELHRQINEALGEFNFMMIRSSLADDVELDKSDFKQILSQYVSSLRDALARHIKSPQKPCQKDHFDDIIAQLVSLGTFRGNRAAMIVPLKTAFYARLMGRVTGKLNPAVEKAVTDLRYPADWYPTARLIKRHIHVHVGPTNSGKTYHALKRLGEAETGCYAGPLRLLAYEVYSRMNARGKPCELITGDDRRASPLSHDVKTPLVSCTVEMVPSSPSNWKPYDVAVIDEIQMIANPERGSSWTAALMGLNAKEVHVCGEERAVPLVERLAAACGDDMTVHRYERLSPLEVMNKPLNLRNLKKGDCVVTFSIMNIHALRKRIERLSDKRCAIIYGGLPPETRAEQARLFNDPDNDYDFLVSSDAIGMGLNLSIKRIIFESIHKMLPSGPTILSTSAIKQIGGRAGRYRSMDQDSTPRAETPISGLSAASSVPAPTTNASPAISSKYSRHDQTSTLPPVVPKPQVPTNSHTGSQRNLGLVSTMDLQDLPYVRKCMAETIPPLEKAGIFPPNHIFERLATYFPPRLPLSLLIVRLFDIARMSPLFFFEERANIVSVADLIHDIPNLSIVERMQFCVAPFSMRTPEVLELVRELAMCVSAQSNGALTDLKNLGLAVLDEAVTASTDYLQKLEMLHKGLVLYSWLSYRFAGVFPDRPLALWLKEMTEARIDETLRHWRFHDRRMARERMRAKLEEWEALKDEGDVDGESPALPRDDDGGVPEENVEEEGGISEGAGSDNVDLLEPEGQASASADGYDMPEISSKAHV